MLRFRAAVVALFLIAAASVCSSAHAGGLLDPAAEFKPRVPLSAFGSGAGLGSWFDRSRFHLTNTVSFGTGWNGQSGALNVTNLSYQFRAPITMSVSIGNTFGSRFGNTTGARNASSAFFLEGLDVAWRPTANSIFRVEMHDVRSPLQYGYSPYGRGFGVVDPFSAGY